MAEAPAVKPAPPPAPIAEGTEFLKNPSGVVWDVEPTHPGIALAKKGDSGWRFATSEEIRAYCELHNIKPPDLRGRAGDIKKASAEGEQLKAEEAQISSPSIEAAENGAQPQPTEQAAAPRKAAPRKAASKKA